MGVISVVYADSQPLVRAGIRRLLEGLDGVAVVGEATDGRELLDRVVARKPQLVITELSLPQVSGIEAAKRIARHMPGIRVLFLSAQAEQTQVRTALKTGASGFLNKAGEPAELEIAIRAVMRGQIYLSPSVSQHAIERRRAQRVEESVILSVRQREVLRLVGRGKSTKEIASLLGIGSKTVETHRSRLMQALNLPNTHALMHFAVRAILEASDER
jgi:DNA-binding NarL/FixJ family response regulator